MDVLRRRPTLDVADAILRGKLNERACAAVDGCFCGAKTLAEHEATIERLLVDTFAAEPVEEAA